MLGAFDAGAGWVAFMIVASSVIAVLYVGRILEVVWFREPCQRSREAAEAPALLLAPTLVLAALTIWFGIDAGWPVGWASRAAALLLGAGS